MAFLRAKKSNTSKWIIGLICLLIIGGIIWWITSTIRENHLQDDPKLFELKDRIKPLGEFYPNLKDVKLYKGDKSYTINKEKIYLCLKDENGEYYPINHLIYVLLHELSHYLNKDDIGHTQKFHDLFEKLIDKAHELGIYDETVEPIQNYCNY